MGNLRAGCKMVQEGVRRAWVVAGAAPVETSMGTTEQGVTAQLCPSPQPTPFSSQAQSMCGLLSASAGALRWARLSPQGV